MKYDITDNAVVPIWKEILHSCFGLILLVDYIHLF